MNQLMSVITLLASHALCYALSFALSVNLTHFLQQNKYVCYAYILRYAPWFFIFWNIITSYL